MARRVPDTRGSAEIQVGNGGTLSQPASAPVTDEVARAYLAPVPDLPYPGTVPEDAYASGLVLSDFTYEVDGDSSARTA